MTIKEELQEQLNALLDRANDLENIINAMPDEKEIPNQKEERPFPQKDESVRVLNGQ
jgi:proteasome assembly chaperone (PAC2) family protein